MEKRVMAWKTKGMNQDFSVSALKNEYVFENRNLRLSTKEDNTLMSWVNERGTKKLEVMVDVTPWGSPNYETTIYGVSIGTAVLDNKLVLFTTSKEDGNNVDRIYVLSYNGSIVEGVLLYKGNLGFDTSHPLETLVSYELGHVKKVYWTDGKNQPRLINIAVAEKPITDKNRTKLKLWNLQEKGGIDTFFDFVPSVKLDETFSVSQEVTSSGTFAPGVIQYCFTYINKYGQETNIIDVSPLYYLTFADRGASPDETKVTCSFTISLGNPDPNFDAVRLYSIQRSSWNGEALVKQLVDLPITPVITETLSSTPAHAPARVPAAGTLDYSFVYADVGGGTLPIYSDNGIKKRVLMAVTKNGTFDVVFDEDTILYQCYYTLETNFITYRGRVTDYEDMLVTFDGIIQLSKTSQYYSDIIQWDKYYAWIDLSRSGKVYEYVYDCAQRNTTIVRDLRISVGGLKNIEFSDGLKAVYNCKNSSWYFTTGNVHWEEYPGVNTIGPAKEGTVAGSTYKWWWEYYDTSYSNYAIPVEFPSYRRIYETQCINGTYNVSIGGSPIGYDIGTTDCFAFVAEKGNGTLMVINDWDEENDGGHILPLTLYRFIIDYLCPRKYGFTLKPYYAYINLSSFYDVLYSRAKRSNFVTNGYHDNVITHIGIAPKYSSETITTKPITGPVIFFNENDNFKAIYNFKDHKWYFSSGEITCNEYPDVPDVETCTIALDIVNGTADEPTLVEVEKGGTAVWHVHPDAGYLLPTTVKNGSIVGNVVTSMLAYSDIIVRVVCVAEGEDPDYPDEPDEPTITPGSISVSAKSLIYIDNGTTGAVIDPYKLLYVGGREIAALTMAEKSQTLFLGNITEKNEQIDAIQDWYKANVPTISFHTGGIKSLQLEPATGLYPFSLFTKKNQRQITTFKGGERYRFGFQLQKATGEWSEPIYLGDATNRTYPDTALYNSTINLVYAQTELTISGLIEKNIYKRIRPVIVYPNIQDRNVLCQGVLNPTVFNAKNRKDKLFPYSQASWYFRPYMVSGDGDIESNYEVTANVTRKSKYTFSDPELPVRIKTTAYIMVGSISRGDTWSSILSYHGITFHKYRHGTVVDTHFYDFNSSNFIGIVSLGAYQDENSTPNMYAFLSRVPWTVSLATYEDTTSSFGYYNGDYNYSESISEEVCAGSNYNLGLKFWIEKSNNVERAYVICNSYTRDSQYNVTFNYDGYVLKCADRNYVYEVETKNPWSHIPDSTVPGSEVEYRHYHALCAEHGNPSYSSTVSEAAVDLVGDVTAGYPYNVSKAKMVEIMGSINEYPSCKNPVGDFESKSNTQFFVDQSIVTLNSPDIEFDTQVQVWGNDNLKLRIVGAIPITSTVSSHSITLKSNMLENCHNNRVNNDTDPDNFQFGDGELNYNVNYPNITGAAGRRLVAEALWNDVVVEFHNGREDKTITSTDFVNYIIHPWHRDISLNSDFSRTNVSSEYKKMESNLLYSYNTEYLGAGQQGSKVFPKISSKVVLTENYQVSNYKLPKQLLKSSNINYYPNIDTVLYNEDKYMAMMTGDLRNIDDTYVKGPISMKYKSTSHIVLSLGSSGENGIEKIHTLPKCSDRLAGESVDVGQLDDYLKSKFKTFWGDEDVAFQQGSIGTSSLFKKGSTHVPHNFLWLGELYKDVTNQFGGNTEGAIKRNVWLIGGPTVKLEGNTVTLTWTDGDTYYQRYDCLKTYPFTKEDTNQLVEILSFMCETHVNIDGRYDKFRGQDKNYLMDPTVFNLINDVYSQQNNYFTGQKLDTEDYKGGLKYPNRAWFSQVKRPGADVDNWTNVVTSSTVEFDGSKGQLNAIKRLGDELIAFQDKGISQILYNEQMQISTQQGVPIEIANSGKVQGVRYFSDKVGCSNKWSMATTPSGIYFMDSENKNIYLFNGQLKDIGVALGFDVWCKNKIKSGKNWSPIDFDEDFVSYYDPINQEVLFIDSEEALAYSEKITSFTSFYDYGNTPYFCTVKDASIWVKPDANNTKLWLHQQGGYCNFFGENKDYYTILIANDNPTQDKIFTNLEFRACIEGKEEDANTHNKDLSTLPFDTIEAWNEYQKGNLYLKDIKGHASMKHYWQKDASLKRKFRMWRCDIPRDGRDRMRNPWLYVKLHKDAATPGNFLDKMELHDFILTYFS